MQWLTDIYGFSKNVKKSKAYLTLVPDHNGWSTMTTIKKDAHRVKRKVVLQAFSDHALTNFEPALQKHIDSLCHRLVGANQSLCDWTEGKTMHEWCKRTVLLLRTYLMLTKSR